MRLFLAIFPDKNTLDYLRDSYRAFDKEKRNLKQIPLEHIHLTLKFVGGRVSDHSKNIIMHDLRQMQGDLPKPEIKLKGLSFGFPRQHDPRILFATVAENPELNELQDIINKIIKSHKLMDTIPWKPRKDRSFHISVARLKPAATRSTGRNVKEILANTNIALPEPFVANEMIAMQSVLTSKQQPTYHRLETIKL